MKVVRKLAVLISLGALASFASAKTDEQVYLDSTVHVTAGTPAPVSVVAPVVSSAYAGVTVEVAFIVDEAGKPTAVNVTSLEGDGSLRFVVTEAVKQWRFKPAQVDGKPVATKVLLPIKFVNELSEPTRVAAN